MPSSRKQLHHLASVVTEKTVITDILKHRFVIEKEFARGGFGRIYSGRQEDSKEYGRVGSLAIKIEPHANGPLFTEITVFQRILTPEKLGSWMNEKKISHIGLPPYVSSGLFTYNGEKLRFLIMPRYEKSLETYRMANGGVLDIHLVLTVMKQCIDCLSYLQDHVGVSYSHPQMQLCQSILTVELIQDYVHGDLKADNILLAKANEYCRCFLVDFGLARLAKGNVYKPDKKRAHNGTLLFTSLDAHRGCAPSFRGDLEILGYNILYWLCGTLPWQSCGQKPDAVMLEKEKFSKELEKNIKILLRGAYVSPLSKLFKLAYETPYLSKVDYENVQLIFNQFKTQSLSSKSLKSRSTRGRENSTALLTGEKMNARKISPSPSGSCTSPSKAPASKRRKSCRIVSQLSKGVSSSSRISSKKCAEIDSCTGSKKKDIKELKPRSHVLLKSVASQNASSLETLLFSSPNVEESPGKKLRNVIPGLQNMKNVRQSLKDKLVKKYINVANEATGKQ